MADGGQILEYHHHQMQIISIGSKKKFRTNKNPMKPNVDNVTFINDDQQLHCDCVKQAQCCWPLS
ncbi:hypothetical protein DERF_003681 [Dermatophagoides farinae]|uniref:Uncharacterized protein n=1 Tax=Dermatophagoides farinae TaxID=6954 RepID=A0A922IHA8_DERFA|nr:hypothetical protein DERF_003681 [Dermatophagoides farinae]